MLPREELLKRVENREIVARIIDLAEQAIKTWEVVETDFLSPPEIAEVKEVFRRLSDIEIIATGGYPQIVDERVSGAESSAHLPSPFKISPRPAATA